MSAAAAIVGALVGFLVGVTSIGGGALLTPALVLVLGVPPPIAVGSDVFIASIIKVVGGGAYALRRAIHWPTVLRLSLGSVPGALLAVGLLNLLPHRLLDLVAGRAIGVALLLAAAASVLKLLQRERASEPTTPGPFATALLGFATGAVVGVTSIGSGSLLLAVLGRFFPLRARTLVGTDIAHAVILSAVAAAAHGFSGRVDLGLGSSVLFGAIPGVIAGAFLATSLPERSLRAGLAAVLAVVGVHLIVRPVNGHAPRGHVLVRAEAR